MTVDKVLIRFSQVAVGIDLQDAKIAVSFGDRFEITKRSAMIAAQQRDEFAGIQQGPGLFVYPVVQIRRCLH